MIGISELYNDEVYDLFDGSRLTLRQRKDLSYFAAGQKWKHVQSAAEAVTLFEQALLRRTQGSTRVNEKSSRSHVFFTVDLKQSLHQSDNVITSKLVITDLAGSERIGKSRTDSSKSLLKETQSINSSLCALGDVVSSLALERPHIPYRNSKLTRLLQDVLGGKSKTVMFANVSGDCHDVQETLATLGFAHRINTVCTQRQIVK
ncbi:hypothetical protein GEMRC1_007817 [Eukaryota sp. GEM-RC1]